MCVGTSIKRKTNFKMDCFQKFAGYFLKSVKKTLALYTGYFANWQSRHRNNASLHQSAAFRGISRTPMNIKDEH